MILPFCEYRVDNTFRISTVVPADGCTTVRDFYDYLCNRLTVQFAPKVPQNRDEDVFALVLSRKMLYDQFAAKVGEHLKVDPTHIRFITINASTNNPKAIVKRTPTITLQQILTPQYGVYSTPNQLPNALYYEVLDLSLSELESKKSLRITWLSEGLTKEVGTSQYRVRDIG